MIYHIVTRSAWDASGTEPYRADSLVTEGFIHCSYADQVAKVANWFYGTQTGLIVLCINPDRLSSAVRAEDPGTGERFPHVYGPIERDAVVAVQPLVRDDAGQWTFTPPG